MTKCHNKSNLMAKGLVYAHSFWVPVYHQREVILSEGSESWPCDSHIQDYREAGHVTATGNNELMHAELNLSFPI